MASKIKVDQLETADGTGTIALQNQLSGLTTASVPTLDYTKMPAGSIIQYASNTSGGTSYLTTSTSYVDAGHDILFTPHLSNSKIHVVLQSRRCNLVTADYLQIKIQRDDTTDIGTHSNGDGSVYIADYDSSAGNQVSMGLNFGWEDSPNTTSQVKYTPYFKVNTGTGYLADSGGIQFYVYEIKQ